MEFAVIVILHDAPPICVKRTEDFATAIQHAEDLVKFWQNNDGITKIVSHKRTEIYWVQAEQIGAIVLTEIPDDDEDDDDREQLLDLIGPDFIHMD